MAQQGGEARQGGAPHTARGGSSKAALEREERHARAVVPRPAATVMVVRDGPHPTSPLEVLLLRRSLHAEFAAGAYVFPGGAVDLDDGGSEIERLCRGLTNVAASATLGLTSGGLAYWVAAVRECFEEAGLLYGCRADGAAVPFADPGVAARLAAHRAALNARERTFPDICEKEGLSLSVDALHYFAHWITPAGPPRRYDTRFFVAAAPEGQVPAHDLTETISDVWARPQDALDRHRAGEMELFLPTVRNLQAIGRFSTVAELLDAASKVRAVPTVLPRMIRDLFGVRLLLPGDPGYGDPDVAGEPAARLDTGSDAAGQHG